MLEIISRHRLQQADRPYQAILWGVTPELATMDWPQCTELLAIDRAEQMIESVWPGDIPGFRRAVVGEWSETRRIAGGPCDLIVGDGSLSCVRYPFEFARLAEAAGESLRDRGMLVMRLHAGPEIAEEPESVLQDLMDLKIGSFHAFKFRFAMALQQTPEEGIELDRIWSEWRSIGIDEEQLASTTGWDLRVIRTIDLYRGKKDRYSFPTLKEHLRVLEAELQLKEVRILSYELGDRRPIVVFSR